VGPPVAAPVSSEEEIRFDHLLEQIWIFCEDGKPAMVKSLQSTGPAGSLPVLQSEPVSKILGRMKERHLVELQNGEALLTPVGSQRARGVVRRHRLAERLFKDTFAVDDAEAHDQACRFEHIISPELDQRICTFLGHPKTCPHGNPIPPGDCCNGKAKHK
jgi:DtxR family transcriptional regulator, Mn-dependent transcriptional regulator